MISKYSGDLVTVQIGYQYTAPVGTDFTAYAQVGSNAQFLLGGVHLPAASTPVPGTFTQSFYLPDYGPGYFNFRVEVQSIFPTVSVTLPNEIEILAY